MRVVVAVLTFSAGTVSPLTMAQDWSVRSGVAARTEYTDNYFLTRDNEQSAWTASITPFATAARRTETSEVAALLAVGANKVWGQVPSTGYLSGRLALDGSISDERSKWYGTVSFVRTPSLQNVTNSAQTTLALAYTNTAAIGGGYSRYITERWSLGANVSAYNNKYHAVESDSAFADNHGYTADATATYIYSDRTRITAATDYLFNSSDAGRSDSVTATVRIVHQFSPRLTASLSAGGFWTQGKSTQSAPAGSGNRSTTDPLFGGGIDFAFTERSHALMAYSENITPTGAGFVSKTDDAVVSFSHQYSDRLIGRLGAAYTRTSFPQVVATSSNKFYRAEIGASYRLAERWTLEMGYRYGIVRYASSGEPRSNLAFVSVAYNWPGASFTDWLGLGSLPDARSSVGTGPLLRPDSRQGPSTTTPDVSPEQSPFDTLTVP